MAPELTSAESEAANERHFRTEHLDADLMGRAVRGGAITLGAQIGKFVVQIGSIVILARLLTPNDFGLVGMVTSLTGFLALFRDLGLSAATVQRAQITHAQVSTLFWVNTGLGILLMLITLAGAAGVAAFYHEPRLTAVTAVLGSGFLFSGVAVQHQALLRRQMRFRALMGIELGTQAFGVALGIALAFRGVGYWSLVWAQFATAALAAPASWMVCQWRPGLPVRGCGVRPMLRFGGNLAAFRAANYWVGNTDNVLIGRFWGAVQLGLYTRAYQLLMMPLSQINTPIAAVAVPALSRLVSEPERYRDAFRQFLRVVALFTMPVVVVTIGTADWIVAVVLGPQWTEAAQIFAWFGIMALSEPISGVTGSLFISQGRTREMFYAELVTGSVGIAAMVVGLPWGAKGVAACFAIASVVWRAPVWFWFAGRSGPVRTRDIYATVAPFAVAALAGLGAVLAFRRWVPVADPILGVLMAAVIAAAVMFSALIAQPAGRSALAGLKVLLPALRGKSPVIP